MARATYVMRNGELVEKHLAAPLHASGEAPMIRTDGMDAVRSMADGKMYDSRSRYYESVKRAGCEIIGNERAPFEKRPQFSPSPVGPDIKRAIEQLRSR